MSASVRSLLLVIAAVLLPAQSAFACGGCLLLSPFRWLFGCDHYCGCPLATPHNCNRFIDDWFGYGYLRNQEGTLGHYPGNWYRRPHAWHQRPMQPYPVVTGGYGMPRPAMLPQPLPAAPIYNPAWNPGWDPCAGMAPQTPVVMQPYPAMAAPVWSSGDCCDPCGGGGTVMYNAPQPAQMMYDGSSGSDCGCSGSHSGSYTLPQAVPPAGMLPQHSVSWQPGGWQPVQAGYPNQYAYRAAQPAAWTPNTVWQQHQATHLNAVSTGYGQTWTPPQQTAWMNPQPYAPQQYTPQPYLPPQYAQGPYAPVQLPPAMANAPVNPYWQSAGTPGFSQPQPTTALMTPPAPVSMGSARLPIRRVSLASPPLGAVGSRSYPNALR